MTEDTFASLGQKMIYHGALKPFESMLLRGPIVPWSYFASKFFHNVYWYPTVGKQRVEAALERDLQGRSINELEALWKQAKAAIRAEHSPTSGSD